MTILTLGAALPDYQWWPDYFEPDDLSLVSITNSTTFQWTNADGSIVTLTGTGFIYADGLPVDGTVSSLTVKTAGGDTLLSATQVNAELTELFDFAFGRPADTNSNMGSDGFGFVTMLLRGNDTINGSANSDDIVGGRNPGNDLINALGGDDYIKGDAGRDTINGGLGYDLLTYTESFWDPTAFRGIVVNVGLQTVLDCWGQTDSILGIESFEGSKYRDTFNGGTGNDVFQGLRGNDSIIGGAGFDEVMYWRDAEFGGQRGIIVDFGAGTIRDGFGNTDTVSGVESVIGTGMADSFTGSANDDQFLGGGGIDTYNGGAGRDSVNFSWGPATNGAIVNLALVSGQVLNDGFGNIETLVSIERIDGNELGDNFQGNAAANDLVGDRGNDVLNGKGGNDFLQGDQGADTLTGGLGADEFYFEKREGYNPWGDRITDFLSGTDLISIRFGDFAAGGMDGTLRFQNGTAAGGTGSWFYFNTIDKGLYWDGDGTGLGAAVRVATLVGVASLTSSDLALV